MSGFYIGRIAQSLVHLADLVEQNNISESDSHDRVEQILENLSEYSAVTGTTINGIALSNLRSVCGQLVHALPAPLSERGRPAIDIPFEVIERYLLQDLKVKEIAELFGVSERTIHRRMQSNGFR